MNEAMHIGVEYKNGQYDGIAVYGSAVRKRVFGRNGSRGDFDQHLMDAIVHCIHKNYHTMWSSSVDNYVSDTKPWSWAENKFVGDYVVLARDHKKPWHKFTKACPRRKERRDMWVQKDGALIIVSGDKLNTWLVFHAGADNVSSVMATSVEDVFRIVANAKLEKRLIF